MQTNIQQKVERLNLLYHRIITNHCIEEHQELFKSLVQQMKAWEYTFRSVIPEIDFADYVLNDHETRLFEILGLMQMGRKYGEATHLYTFTQSMRQSERNLYQEIYISLCKRNAINNGYFHTDGISDKIDFIESGHWIDTYILL